MEPYIEGHLHWRFLTSCDWDEVVALRSQLAVLDDSLMPAIDRVVGVDVDLEDSDAVGGWDSYGSLLAFGCNFRAPEPHPLRIYLIGGVHPTHRYQGIGGALLTWQEQQAMAWRDAHRPGDELWLGCYVEAMQPGLQHLLESRGFQVDRYFIDMHRNLDELPQPAEIPGIRFQEFTEQLSPQVLQLHNECFTSAVSEQAWDESLRSDTFRSDWSWVAIHDDRVIGYCLSGTDDGAGLDGVLEGWCDRLGVAEGYRHQGVAQSLLARAMYSMADSGCPAAGIGVDTRQRAVADWLNRVLGYEVRDSVILFTKSVPASVS